MVIRGFIFFFVEKTGKIIVSGYIGFIKKRVLILGVNVPIGARRRLIGWKDQA
jgi:hypothetical protein